MKKTIAFGMAAAVAAAVAGSASATDVYMATFNGVSPQKLVNYVYSSGQAWNYGHQSGGVQTQAGRFNWNGNSIGTFCTQLGEYVAVPVTYQMVDVSQVPDPSPNPNPGQMGTIKSGLIRDLYARNWSAVSVATADTAANQLLNAAFQLCIWEISHENLAGDATLAVAATHLSVDTGQMQFNGDATLLSSAASMLAALGTGGFLAFDSVWGLTNADAQDQLIVIPIPAPALLAGLGLLGVGVIRRRIAK